MKERLLSSLTVLLVLCYGCTGQDGGGLSGVGASAANAVVSTARLDALVENPRDVEVLTSMARIYANLSAVANASRDGAGIFTDFLTQKAPLATCVTQDDELITYDDCTVSNGIIEGTVSSVGDDIDFDLAILAQATGAAGSLAVLMAGGITLTGRSLSGLLNYETIIDGVDEYPDGLSFTMDAEYIDIILDETQCPLSGSLRVEQEFLGESTGVVEAFFGPVCGDVRILE